MDGSFSCSSLQVRRGMDEAEIYSIAFNQTSQWLAVSSDKGTVHVFNIKVGLAGDAVCSRMRGE